VVDLAPTDAKEGCSLVDGEKHPTRSRKCNLMSSHGQKMPPYETPRVAFDVALGGVRYAGRAADTELRDSVAFTVPELPWELRFYFVRTIDSDTGETGRSCVGFDVGTALSREAADGLEVTELAVTPDRVEVLFNNLWRYQVMAKRLLIFDVPEAKRTRSTMARRRTRQLTDDDLALLVSEIRAHQGIPGALTEIAIRRGVHRSTIYRQVKEAERRGLAGKLEPNA
jgi:hypothetical protein